MRAGVLAGALLLALPGLAFPQLPTVNPQARDAALAAVQQRFSAELAAATDKRAVYRRMFEELIRNEGLYPRLSNAEYRALLQKEAAEYQRRIRETAPELRESAISPSVNAPASNPISNQLVERAGVTQILALAADLRRLFSADESAVTVNLNALGLFRGGRTADVDAGAQHFYSQREAWRRLGGSITFGAKIPEKEITGLSGIPSAETLFDALGWDIKYRVYGDRDPRAGRWYGLFIDRLGTITELAAVFATSTIVPAADTGIALAALNDVVGQRLQIAANQVANSLVVSGKFAGQHLTTVTGRNKYTSAIMVDKGFANVDLTANTTFTWADAPATGPTATVTARQWHLAAALTGSILENVLFADRAAELSGSISGTFPLSDEGILEDRRRIVNVNATLIVPFQEKGKIPLSFTYSSDPNNLVKEKYVSGQIGFSYDFGTLKSLLK